MSISKYINKNKIAGIILIIVIIIAFGFGGFGGGFISNNQNNIAKIDKTNVTTQDLVDYINRSGISQQQIRDNLDNNIIEELLSGLISSTLLDLEIKDFDIILSENSLSKKIKLNKNFHDDNGEFNRIKYEKFLLENNISAPLFEQRLKNRELQKSLFDFIGAGTASPQFLITKLFKDENRKLELDFINLENLYKKNNEFSDKELIKFIDENESNLKVEYIDFRYAIINPQNLIGANEFNKTFFDKIDEIENNILNGVSFDKIALEFNLDTNSIQDYRYSDDSDEVKKRVFEVRNNKFDIFENDEDYVIFKIDNLQKKKPNLNDKKTREEIINLLSQKNKFDYNKNLLDQIRNNNFNDSNFLKLGNDKIKTIVLNSIKDNNKFNIDSVQMLYSLPINTFTLINDDDNNIYLVKLKNYVEIDFDNDQEKLKQYIAKEKTNIRKKILKSYDVFINKKYKIDINQNAINKVKNLF